LTVQTALEKIRELRALHEDGLLSRIEFDRRKDAILDNVYHDERSRAAAVAREGTELGLMAGQEVGPPTRRYRLMRLAACGAMAEVWQALDLATEAQLGHSAEVALKILPPQRVGATHAARLLVEEALRTRRLAHENLVRVYDWSQDPATGCTFLVMEYLDGEDLDSLLAREGKLPFARACALLAPVAQALDYAWERQRLVHRDLKPANLFLLKDGSVKLLDFGIAGSADAGLHAPNNSGTAPYRAPESADPQLAPDRALDVHAAAVMLYLMIEGALPFAARRSPRAAPAGPASMPAAVWEVLRSGFAPEAGQRPHSVSDLLARLARAAAEPAEPSPPVLAAPRPLASVAAPRPGLQPRRPPTEAEREARKEALRRSLRQHLAQEQQERTRAAAGTKPAPQRIVSNPASVIAGASLLNAGASGHATRLDFASTAPAPSQGRAATSSATEAAASRKRLRDQFLDGSAEGPELVALPAGRFQMGSTADEREAALAAGARKAWLEREAPRHAVDIANPFAIGRHPVTVGQWRLFVLGTRWKGASGINWATPGFVQGDEHPVVGVTWHDAQLYVRWLSARTGKRYRLASEAEWEYACRAGTSTPFSFGDTIRPDQANYDTRFAWDGAPLGVPRRGTTAAGSYPANAWDLCDMHGNVWEWVQDVMHESFEGAPTDGSAWEQGGDQVRRVLRGGSWLYHPRYLRSAVRNGFAAKLSNDKVGFRVVRALD
jgi:formylglycine-generating enzyme required for sulfatase activity